MQEWGSQVTEPEKVGAVEPQPLALEPDSVNGSLEQAVVCAARAGSEETVVEGEPEAATTSTSKAAPVRIAQVIITALALGVLALVLKQFEGRDRLVPVGFIALEMFLGCVGLEYLRATHLREFAEYLGRERLEVVRLGRRGATLADTLILTGDERRNALESAHGAASTLANLLIVVGMVGTAWYLLDNAHYFTVQGVNIEGSLQKMLAIAPKAFAATGLALASAAVVSMMAAFAVRAEQKRAAQTGELVEAWELGVVERRVVGDDNARIIAALERLPEQINSAAATAGGVTVALSAAMTELKQATSSIAALLTSSSDSVRRVLDESVTTHATLAKAAKASVKVAEQLEKTQVAIAESTAQSIQTMREVLQEHESKLLSRTVEEVPRMVVDAIVFPLERAIERFSKEFEQRNNLLIGQLQDSNVNSFALARQSFEQAVSSSSEHVRRMSEEVRALQDNVLRLSSGVADANIRWPASIEGLERLTSTLAILHGHATGTGSAVDTVLASLRETSRVLSERASNVGANSQLVGEVLAIIRSDTEPAGRSGRDR